MENYNLSLVVSLIAYPFFSIIRNWCLRKGFKTIQAIFREELISLEFRRSAHDEKFSTLGVFFFCDR